jgi:hypothetical protein
MWPSLKPTQRVALLGNIPPQSATTVQTSGWINVADFENLLFVISIGAMISTGLVDATIQQATSSGGAGAKALGTPISITEATYAANPDTEMLINLNAASLDTNNGFTFVELSITPSVEAALIAGEVWGFDPKYATDATTLNNASVVQVLG